MAMLYFIDAISGIVLLGVFGLRRYVSRPMRPPYDLATVGFTSLFGSILVATLVWVSVIPHAKLLTIALFILGIVSLLAAAIWAAAKSTHHRRNVTLVASAVIILFGYYSYRHFSEQAAYNQELQQLQSNCVRGCN